MSKSRLSVETLMQMNPDVLRALIRERAHHTLEIPIYRALLRLGKGTPRFSGQVQDLLEVWTRRGLPTDSEDLKWVHRLLSLAEDVKQGRTPDLGTGPVTPFSEAEIAAVEKAILGRRSIRFWTDEHVPGWMIERIVEAGLWAPHACNLQTIRVLIIDDEDDMRSLLKSDVTGYRVFLVVCQDVRPYEVVGSAIPERNRQFDCGAAVQNMLLMCHAFGLGAVWLTLTSSAYDNIRQRYRLPEHLHVSTAIGLGWPAALSPLPPGRISVQEATIDR